jgi:hypothetical protein
MPSANEVTFPEMRPLQADRNRLFRFFGKAAFRKEASLKYYQTDAETLREFEGERITKAEERTKSNSRRLDRLERLTDEVSKQNENIARLVVQLEFTNRQLTAHDKRLRDIESRPRHRAEYVFGAIITALCSALAGAAVTLLF